MTPLIILLLISTIFSSCAPSGGGSGSIATAPVEAVLPSLPKTGDTLQMPIGNDPVNLTYYTHTKTVTPDKNWVTKTYTATASCVTYNSYVFCWDDGLKNVVIMGNTFTYAYFGFQINPNNSTQVEPCYGGCSNDFFSQPRVVSQWVESTMNSTPEAGKVKTVLTNGVPKTVSCQLQGSLLNCVDFQIDLTQPVY